MDHQDLALDQHPGPSRVVASACRNLCNPDIPLVDLSTTSTHLSIQSHMLGLCRRVHRATRPAPRIVASRATPGKMPSIPLRWH